jgi:hypothetical protein
VAPAKGHKFNENRRDLGKSEGGRAVKYDTKFIEREAEALLDWLSKGKFVWFEKFCLERNYNPDLMAEWAKKNEKFAEAYAMARARQRILLIEAGLMKKFNYNMTQLLLGHHYGIFPKIENKMTGDAVNPLAFILQSIDGTTKELINDKQ